MWTILKWKYCYEGHNLPNLSQIGGKSGVHKLVKPNPRIMIAHSKPLGKKYIAKYHKTTIATYLHRKHHPQNIFCLHWNHNPQNTSCLHRKHNPQNISWLHWKHNHKTNPVHTENPNQELLKMAGSSETHAEIIKQFEALMV
jgi:hypothetical protein